MVYLNELTLICGLGDNLKEKILKVVKSETGSYLIFGAMTTFVNYVSFWIALQFLGYNHILTVNTISFICAVAFAYITNKLYVFKSKSWHYSILIKEIATFLSARLLSYFFEQAGLYLCADIWHLEKYIILGIDGVLISKVVLSFLVVLLNWAVSKYFIFKKSR